MKRFIYFSALALAAAVAFSSCEKDPLAGVPESTVYLSAGATQSNEVNYVINYDALTGAEQTVGTTDITIKLCATENVGADVTAELKIDESLVAAGFTLLPEAAYTISSTSATIAKDSKESTDAYKITLKPEAVEAFGSYVLPLTIEVTAGKAVLSTTAAVLNVKFVRNRLNSDIVPEGWSKIAADRFTAGSYKDSYGDYIGIDYTEYGMGLASAFDGNLSTDWYGTSGYWEGSNFIYSETAADDYGVWAEVKFSKPTAVKGLIVSANPDSQYYKLRPRRMTVLVKYEDSEDYDWGNKSFDAGYVFDENGNYVYDDYGYPVMNYNVGDDGSYAYISDNSGINKVSLEGYQKADADYLIDEPGYSNYSIDLSSRFEGKKVVSMILIPATLVCSQWYYDDTLQDFWYTYYYDYFYGTATSEITIFE